MGNTPSHQHAQTQSPPAPANAHGPPSRHPSLRLALRNRHNSPQHSTPTSPSGRPGSPNRRRRSLELPDLNRLSFTPAALTPAAPVPTTHTHTSHHLAPSTAASRRPTETSPPVTPAEGINNRRWKDTIGGRASPLTGNNKLGAMSKLDSATGSPPASAALNKTPEVNPYFPDPYGVQDPTVSKAVPIPIPGKSLPEVEDKRPKEAEATPVRQPMPVREEKTEKDDGMVDVPIQWNGGGKNVYVAGTWDGGWSKRIKLHRSTHDFNTIIRLPPGQYRLKFIVDDSWRCSKQISTATDDDGTLVNWIEVEVGKTEEEARAEWAMDAKPAVGEEDTDDSQWTSEIPPSLILYQYIEELPSRLSPSLLASFLKSVPYIPNVPSPPTLPRILDKVIVNNDSKRLWDGQEGGGYGPASQAGLDDNSILAVPNHVVLNHLTASAIRNGTLGVGTTTRYRKKYITTMFFRDQPSSTEQQSVPVPRPVQ